MQSSVVHFLRFSSILILVDFMVLVSSRSDIQGYDYSPLPDPYLPPRDVSCNQCRPSTHCVTELDIRDENVPMEIPIPTLDYQIRWESKLVHVVEDFDVRDNPCPVELPLQDKEIRIEPRIREVEKIVRVRVPRIRENVIVKRIDRVRLVPVVQSISKPINVQHIRQVPAPVKIVTRKTILQKKYSPEVEEIAIPVRIANVLDVIVNHVDKPVEVPSVTFKFCENIQEIKVKANCPTVPKKPAGSYLPALI